MIKLYDYFRSTASYRVRIALNLKGVSYDKMEVHLVNEGGQQHLPAYRALNPQGLVPALDTGEAVLTQSLAIIEYLEETVLEPPLLPADPLARATVRMLSQMIVSDIHPLNNLRVLKRLKQQFKADETQITDWYHHWLNEGFTAIETKLGQIKRTQPLCYGNSVSMADICLIPQVFNAQRFDFLLEDFPLIQQINSYCLEMDAFSNAAP